MRAIGEEKKRIYCFVKSIKPDGYTDYISGFKVAFNIFKDSVDDEFG